MGVIHKIGRRKTAVACFWKEQSNHCKQKKNATYLLTVTYKVMQPMSMTENATNFDVKVNVLRWFNWTSRSCKNGTAMCV
jgi:small subunit ribosomal protein S9